MLRTAFRRLREGREIMRRQITSLIRPQMLLIQALGLLALGVLILVRPYAIEAVISRILAVALGLTRCCRLSRC